MCIVVGLKTESLRCDILFHQHSPVSSSFLTLENWAAHRALAYHRSTGNKAKKWGLSSGAASSLHVTKSTPYSIIQWACWWLWMNEAVPQTNRWNQKALNWSCQTVAVQSKKNSYAKRWNWFHYVVVAEIKKAMCLPDLAASVLFFFCSDKQGGDSWNEI